MVGNFVLRPRTSGAVKRNFLPYFRQYTSPNEHFEYGYPHSYAHLNIYSSKAQYFAPNWSFVSNIKQLRQPITMESLMTSVLQRYIAEYSNANSWPYPIRHRVTFASALEFLVTILLSKVVPCSSELFSCEFHLSLSWWQNKQNHLCAQQKHISAWVSAQSDQSLRCPLEES